MPTSFGMPRDADGNGTTPQDIQRILASRYENAGILTGAKVTTRSDWQYLITAGAAVIDMGSDLAVEIPIEQQLVKPDPAPATGTRVDTIYAAQQDPAVDGGNLAYVGITTAAKPTVPARSVILGKRSVPAGATATSSTTETYDRRYAVLSGGSLGSLGYVPDWSGTPHGTTGVHKHGSMKINVPTDRFIECQITTTISLGTADGSNAASVPARESQTVMVRLYIDNQLRKSFEVSYNRFWESKQIATTEQVSAGTHQIHYTIEPRYINPDIPAASRYWVVRAGGPDNFRGNTIAVHDRGVAV